VGAKHLAELSASREGGGRAVMLYVVQRTDCARFRLAPDLDPAYARAFDAARAAGVEMICHGTEISPGGVTLSGPLPVDPSPEQSGSSRHRRLTGNPHAKTLAYGNALPSRRLDLDDFNGRLTKDGIRIHNPEDFAGMHAAGRIAADILDRVAPMVVPGATTGEIDTAIERWWRMPARPRPRSVIAAMSTPAASR
jgi:hypothetical protein